MVKPSADLADSADKAYDSRRCRQASNRRKIQVRIARKGVESSERLGRYR